MLKLSLKNPFSKSTTPPDPSETVSPGATDKAWGKLKGFQLLAGRTRTKVEALTGELDDALLHLTQARQQLGEALSGDEAQDVNMDELTRVENRVKALDAALTVAKQKDAEAQRTLTDAERQAAIAADEEVVAAFKASVLALESLLCGELKRAAEKVGVARQGVIDRAAGGSGVASTITDFDLWFPVYLHRACSALIPSGRVYSQVLDRDKKTLSAWPDAVMYAVTSRRVNGKQ